MIDQEENRLSRRQFLLSSALAAGGFMLPTSAGAQDSMQMPPASATGTPPVKTGPAEVSLRIGPVLVDVTKDKTLSTIGYNGQVPGPLIRLREGKQVSVQIFNDTDSPEFVHWHGQFIPSEVDGAGEEKSIVVPPRGQVSYKFTPRPAGIRWVHTHVMPGSNLYRGLYTGQFGIVYVEPNHDSGSYDQEVFLATHEFDPFYSTGEMEEEGGKPEEAALEAEVKADKTQKSNGWEIGY
jgi:FtsP/CotA-like multicopper oxidase with cupredoxin domain